LNWRDLLRRIRQIVESIGVGLIIVIVFSLPFWAAAIAYAGASRSGSPDAYLLAMRVFVAAIILMLLAYAVGSAIKNPPSELQSAEADVVPLTTDASNQVIEIWKATLETQQHFNNIEMTIRNYAVTVLVAVLGGAALALKEKIVVDIGPTHMSLSALVLVAGVIGWAGFYSMDRFWYHPLLIGSVRHGLRLEKRHGTRLPELALATTIRDEAAKQTIHTASRIDFFYLCGMLLQGIFAAAVLFSFPASGTAPKEQPQPQTSREEPRLTSPEPNSKKQEQRVPAGLKKGLAPVTPPR
jgi:hypothetical protein